jgi:hypothetical protein
MEFGLEITGDRTATLRFEQFPQQAHDRLLTALQAIEARLEAAVLAQAPDKTGALRSLIGGRVYDHDTRIAAVVGVRTTAAAQARKASALEYGSHAPIAVRAHTAKLAHFWSRMVNPIMVDVRAHGRTPNIVAKKFLRGPIEAIRGQALAELQAALDAAVEGANA